MIRNLALGGAAFAVVLMFAFLAPTLAQEEVTFTPQDTFNIPQLHGSLRFIINVSATSVTLQNGTFWVFENLRLNGSRVMGTLKVSVENSDITIFNYGTSNFGRGESFRYFAEGQGKQTLDLDVNSTRQTHVDEWLIANNGNAVADGKGWQLTSDNVVVVEGLVGNVSLSRYSFFEIPKGTGNFLIDHSVALIVAAVLLATVGACLIVKFKGNPK